MSFVLINDVFVLPLGAFLSIENKRVSDCAVLRGVLMTIMLFTVTSMNHCFHNMFESGSLLFTPE